MNERVEDTIRCKSVVSGVKRCVIRREVKARSYRCDKAGGGRKGKGRRGMMDSMMTRERGRGGSRMAKIRIPCISVKDS